MNQFIHRRFLKAVTIVFKNFNCTFITSHTGKAINLRRNMRKIIPILNQLFLYSLYGHFLTLYFHINNFVIQTNLQ